MPLLNSNSINNDKIRQSLTRAVCSGDSHAVIHRSKQLFSDLVRSCRFTLLFFLLVVGTLSSRRANAQVATIDPGMTRAQVIAKLGQPLSAHSFDSHTYLLYKNGCEKTCGINDFVVLDSDKVVDAVFRSPSRKYTGKSSSPVMITALEARKGVGAPAKSSPPSPPPPKKRKP